MEGSQGLDQEALTALSNLFEGLDNPEARRQFIANPLAKTSDLPQNVQQFLNDLSYSELRALVRTWNEMKDAGLTYDMDGVTVSFL